MRLDEPTAGWFYQIPSYTDDDGDVVTLAVTFPINPFFVVFDSATDKIKITDLASPSVLSGSYQITVTLSDGTNNVINHINLVVTDPAPLPVV